MHDSAEKLHGKNSYARKMSLGASPLRCSSMWHQVMYLPLSQSVPHGRITMGFFLSSKENNFEIAISYFDKFCVGNSILTFIVALCPPDLLHRMTCERTNFHVTKQAKEKFPSDTCSWNTF